MSDTTLIDELRGAADEYTPSRDARDRMRPDFAALVVEDTTATARRRPRAVSVVAVTVCALVVAVAFALAPDTPGARRAHVPSPTSARAALDQAGASASAEEWTPLTAGQFHHVGAAEIPIRIPDRYREVADPKNNFRFTPPPRATETWLDGAGVNLSLSIQGGSGDAGEFPSLSHSGGRVSGMSLTAGNYDDISSLADSLRFPDSVSTTREDVTADRATQQQWYRQASGWVRGSKYDGRPYDPATRAQLEQRFWQVGSADVVRLANATAATRDRVLLDVLDQHRAPASWGPKPGEYGATAASRREEHRVSRAVDLLGSAPLDPVTRQAVFAWLGRQAHATLDGSVKDELGRTGTSVTFVTDFDQPVVERTVTLDQLKRASGLGNLDHLTKPSSFTIKAHHRYRQWFVNVIFDEQSGELLQQTQVTRYGENAMIPTIERRFGKYAAKIKVRTPRYLDHLASQLYLARDRMTSIEPTSSACSDAPQVCG